MNAQRDGRCARGDLHWDAPQSAAFEEGEPIEWSFIGNGWAHAVCVRDEVEPEEFAERPPWRQSEVDGGMRR